MGFRHCLGGQLGFDRRHQARLADAGFAVKQYDRAGPVRGFPSRIHKGCQLLIPLQQASRHPVDGIGRRPRTLIRISRR
jgi:hypothetical protein